MLKHYIFMLFPIIIFGNNIYGTDDPYSYKKSKNYMRKDQYNNQTDNGYNNQTTIGFYDPNAIKINQLEIKIKNLSEQLLQEKIQNKLLQNYINYNNIKQNELERNIGKLHKENNKLNNELSDIKRQLKMKQENLLQFENKNQNDTNIINNLHNNSETQNKELIKLKTEIINLNKAKEKLEQRNEEKENRITELTKELFKIKQDNEKANKQLTNQKKLYYELLQARENNQKLNESICKYKRIEKQLSELTKKNIYLKDILSSNEHEIENLKSQKKEKDTKILSLNEQIERLQNDIKILQNKKSFNNLQMISQSIEIKNNKKIQRDIVEANITGNNVTSNNDVNKNTIIELDNINNDINYINNNEKRKNEHNINSTHNDKQNHNESNKNQIISKINNENNSKITDKNCTNNESNNEQVIENTKNAQINKYDEEINMKEVNSTTIQSNNQYTQIQEGKKDITGKESVNKINIESQENKINNNNINEEQSNNIKKKKNKKRKKKHKNKIQNNEQNNEIVININDISDNNKLEQEIIPSNNINRNIETQHIDKEIENEKVIKNHSNNNIPKKQITNSNTHLKIDTVLESGKITQSEINKIKLKNKIAQKYAIIRHNMKYLQNHTTDIWYELPINDNIKYNKDDYNKIYKKNEFMIQKFYDQLNDKNAVKVSSNSIGIYQINNDSFLTKDQITYRNLIFFMIGKILEIQQYNDNVKNVNEQIGIPIALMQLNSDNILDVFRGDNIQNCIDSINDNIYYSIDFCDKCKNQILRKNIFNIHNIFNIYSGDTKIAQYSKKVKNVLEKEIQVLTREYMAQYIQNILISKVNSSLPNDLVFDIYYEIFMRDIIGYSYLISNNTNEVAHEYKKVIEILCKQLLYIIHCTKDDNDIEILSQKINEIFQGSIKYFMPYIKYWAELDYEYGKDKYKLIENKITGYILDPDKKSFFKKNKDKVTLEDITNTINDFFKNKLDLNYEF